MIAVQSGYSEGFDLFQKGVREIQGTPTATPANASLSLIRDVWKRFGKHDFYLVVSTPGHPFFQWHLIQDNSYLYQRVARKLTGGIALDTLGILTDGRLSPARLSSIDDFATVRANESTLSAAAIVARGGGSANRRQVLDFPSEWLQPESSFAFCRIRFQEIGKKVDAEEEPDDEFGRAYARKMAQLTIDE
jgi:hypothetical protein